MIGKMRKKYKTKPITLISNKWFTSNVICQRMVTSLFIPNSGNAMDMIKKDIFRPLPNSNRNNINLGVCETANEEYEQESCYFL